MSQELESNGVPVGWTRATNYLECQAKDYHKGERRACARFPNLVGKCGLNNTKEPVGCNIALAKIYEYLQDPRSNAIPGVIEIFVSPDGTQIFARKNNPRGYGGSILIDKGELTEGYSFPDENSGGITEEQENKL